MPLLLNILGVLAALPIILAAARVLHVSGHGKRYPEVSARTVIAFAFAIGGFLPIKAVCEGHNLTAGHVLLLVAISTYIVHRLWVAVVVLKLDPRRNTDFAELL